MKEHSYSIFISWTGNLGTGTSAYPDYERSYQIQVENKAIIDGSSDPAFRGDKTKYNPEELFIASISSCHMLWYIHLCSVEGVVVIEYEDNAQGLMLETANGGGRFKEVTLNPKATLGHKSMEEKARELHSQANELCFIASSLNFKVYHNPTFIIKKMSL